MLIIFPGWLSPFSNTIGYLATRMAGVKDFLSSILAEKLKSSGKGKSGDAQAITESLQHIYGNESLLLNEVTTENFDTFWKRMTEGGLIKASANTTANKLELLNYVRMKNSVAEWVWYMLTGNLVTAVAFNYMIHAGCEQSTKELEERKQRADEKYEEKLRREEEGTDDEIKYKQGNPETPNSILRPV